MNLTIEEIDILIALLPLEHVKIVYKLIDYKVHKLLTDGDEKGKPLC